MSKNILFFPSYSEHEHVYESLLKLRELGYTVYSLCDKILEHPVDVFEKQLICDITKTKETIEFLKQQNIHFDAAFTNSVELVTPLIALLAKHYGFVGNEPKTAFYCRSKYHMRQKLSEANIPSPKFELCKNYEDIKKAVEKIKVPCVLKPVGWHSSFGTFMIRDNKDLEQLESNYKRSIDFLTKEISEIAPFTKEELNMLGIDDDINMATDYIVEEYMDGPEITVDTVVQKGKTYILAVQDQLIIDPPYFIRIGGQMPSRYEETHMKEIEELIQKTVDAMEIKNSMTHTEIIFTKDGPRIVEIACRSGSDDLHEAIYQRSGYSTAFESAMLALGIERTYDIKAKCHISTKYLLPDKEGIISSIEIPNEIRNDPNKVEILIAKIVGKPVAPPPENFDSIGFVSAKGDTPKASEENMERIIKGISIKID